jgi:hypothetical protein
MPFSKMLGVLAILSVLALPRVTFATTLTTAQASAIIGLLEAFDVDSATIARVEVILSATPSAASVSTSVSDPSAFPTTSTTPHVPPDDNVYPPSALGFDLSFNTIAYPATSFQFAVVGINGGKSFVHNARLSSEYAWAHFASEVAPTLYVNLNAPFGSTVAGHVDTPKACAGDSITSITTASTTAPTTCEGYDYGYHAAADAFAYAKSQNVSASFWWIDIEEANSWADATSTNDATIQGALDYLNEQGIRVGIYSTPGMWENIAGTGFVPTQTINGSTMSTPTWFPIGISTQTNATNACVTDTSFIPGSPIWILQYEQDFTAIDQNIAC